MRIAAAVLSLIGWAVLPAGVADADCTGAGDFGAASGCAPPGASSGGGGKAESWPPTSVDWPPQLDADTGSDSKGGGDAQSTPIVMPDGQKAPPVTHPSSSDPTSTSTPPKPIVPVGAPAAGTTGATGTTTATETTTKSTAATP
jgi:hypothetical protein